MCSKTSGESRCRFSLLSRVRLLILKDFHAREPLEFCFIEYWERSLKCDKPARSWDE
jgi:hypothetical protein